KILRERFPAFGFLPVLNDAVAHGPDLRRQFSVAGRLAPLHIPQMSPNLRSIVDRRPFSFAPARLRPPAGLAPAVRDELEFFMKRVLRDMRELELALLMNDLQTSLAVGSARRRAT